MLFNTPIYLILLFTTFLFLNFSNYKKTILVISSIIFFIFAGNKDFLIFYITLLSNYFFILLNINQKIKLIFLIVFNISILFFFKYFNFFAGIILNINDLKYLYFTLPVGISFYIFQLLGYHIDSYRNSKKFTKEFSVFLIFISFFPQLIAGPIMRASQLIPQIKRLINSKKVKKKILVYGLLIILIGLIKKIILADNLSLIVDNIFNDLPKDYIIAWAGAFLFTFQIYFDFSGYSDIAIGSAYILGLRLVKNFNTPYFSTSPSEFWQRWHISLSSWIRDYIYIPLGGSKKSLLISFYILLFTMILAGLWHGANYTFVVWGLCWALYIFIFRFFKDINKKFTSFFWILNFLIIMILWVIFRSDNLTYAYNYILIMLTFNVEISNFKQYFSNLNELFNYFFIIIFLFTTHYLEKHYDNIKYLLKIKRYNTIFYKTLLISSICIITILPNENPNPFIYFKF